MAYYPFAVEKGANYRLVGPDGSVAVFNDPTDPNYVGMLTDVSGLDSAEVRESAQDLTEADGGAHGFFYYSRRPIVLTASVFNHQSIAERNLRIDRARRASNALRGDATLTWKPSTRRENYVKNPNIQNDIVGLNGFLGGTQGTGAVQPTIARITTDGYAAAGASSAAEWVTTNGQSTPDGYLRALHQRVDSVVNLQADAMPVVPGQILFGHAAMKWTVGPAAPSFGIQVTYFDAAGTQVTSSNMGGVGSVTSPGTPTINTWYALFGTTTVPAGCVYAVIRPQFSFRATTTTAEAYTVRTDAAFLGPANTVNDMVGYFDGNTTGYYWQGDPGSSRSGDFIEMFTTLRRQQRFTEGGAWVKEIQIPMVSEYATLFSTGLKTLSGSPVSCENRGSYTSYPVIEITGASVNPRVTTTAGGDFRTTGLTLAAGEVVQFDMLNHTGTFTAGARVGQSANRYIDFALTKWVTLPGIATTPVTLTSGGGSMRVMWRDVWA